MKIQLWIAAVALIQVGPAFGEQMKGPDMSSSATNPASKAYMQEMATMHDATMGMKPTNDTSQDFVMMMKPHHQAAVDMAKTYLKYGKDPELTRMAQDIVTSQNKEIAEMSAWQAKHVPH